MPEIEDPLVGTWNLISWYNEGTGSDPTFPFGTDPVGRIGYTQDGYMFAQISEADRAPYAIGLLMAGTPEEDVAAMKSCLAYSGPYEFRGDQVVHHVTVSTFPNWWAQNRGALCGSRASGFG
jgi:hypothetical protein